MIVVDFVMELLIKSLVTILALVGTIIIAGFILGILKNIISKYTQYSVGWKGIIFTGIIGTPVHELGHALMCYIFGHKVMEMKLFPSGNETTLGYVSHSYNSKSIYQRVGNFFIGIGPILSGTGLILLLMWLTLPSEFHAVKESMRIYTWQEFKSFAFIDGTVDMAKILYKVMFVKENFKTIVFWVFMFLAICISSHMALSTADMKGAFSGLVVMYVLSIGLNIVAPLLGGNGDKFVNAVVFFNSYMLFALIIALFCSACAAAGSLALYGIRIILEN